MSDIDWRKKTTLTFLVSLHKPTPLTQSWNGLWGLQGFPGRLRKDSLKETRGDELAVLNYFLCFVSTTSYFELWRCTFLYLVVLKAPTLQPPLPPLEAAAPLSQGGRVLRMKERAPPLSGAGGGWEVRKYERRNSWDKRATWRLSEEKGLTSDIEMSREWKYGWKVTSEGVEEGKTWNWPTAKKEDRMGGGVGAERRAKGRSRRASEELWRKSTPHFPHRGQALHSAQWYGRQGLGEGGGEPLRGNPQTGKSSQTDSNWVALGTSVPSCHYRITASKTNHTTQSLSAKL